MRRFDFIKRARLVDVTPIFMLSRRHFRRTQEILACEQALLFGQAKRASGERASEGPRGFAVRSRVLARLVSLAQIGELARRLKKF